MKIIKKIGSLSAFIWSLSSGLAVIIGMATEWYWLAITGIISLFLMMGFGIYFIFKGK